MSLSITEGNVLAVLKAAPQNSLTFLGLAERFGGEGSQKALLQLLFAMRKSQSPPIEFKKGWVAVNEIVVSLNK